MLRSKGAATVYYILGHKLAPGSLLTCGAGLLIWKKLGINYSLKIYRHNVNSAESHTI